MKRLGALAAWLGGVVTRWRDGAAILLSRVGTSWWAPALLVAITALVVLERIDAALAATHDRGARAGGVGDIASPARLFTPEVAAGIVDGWDERVVPLLQGYLVIDTLLMGSVVVLLEVSRRALGGARVAGPGTYAAAVRAALGWSLLAIVGYFVLDLLETVFVVLASACMATDPGCAAWSGALAIGSGAGALSVAKWVMLAAAVVPQVLILGGTWRTWGRQTLGVAGLVALRGHLLVVALLIGLFLVLQGGLGRQLDDVTVHAAGHVGRAILATAAALLASLALLVGGTRASAAFVDPPTSGTVGGRTLLVATGVAVLLVAAGASVLGTDREELDGFAQAMLLLPGLALLSWVLLTLPPAVRESELAPASRPTSAEVEVRERALRWWVRGLAMVPVTLLFLANVRASTTLLADAALGFDASFPTWLVAWMLFLLVALCVFAPRVHSWADEASGLWHPFARGWAAWLECVLWTAVPLLMGLLLALVTGPGSWMAVGTLTTVFVLACLAIVLATGLTLLGDLVAPPGALALLRLRRLPVISGLILWGLVASTMDQEGAYYDVRLAEASTPVAGGVPIYADAALTDFVQEREDLAAGRPVEDGTRKERPVVLVAAAGGGVRAAYWTSLVWQCAFESLCDQRVTSSRTGDVFFASGVSGGAVGLALTLAQRPAEGGLAEKDWPQEAFEKDRLAPAVAGFVLRDLPNSLARWPAHGKDRAAQLEQAWQHGIPGMSDPWTDLAGQAPYVSFSGTSVEDGCRLALSTLWQEGDATACRGDVTTVPKKGSPGSSPVRDGVGYLCDRELTARNIDLATAALLSARFPFVSPAGALHDCGGGASTYVLDGGIFDNSGGAAVTNVLTQLEEPLRSHNSRTNLATCLVPHLLIIDSAYASTAQPVKGRRPLQTAGPAQSIGAIFDSRSTRHIAEAAAAVEAAAMAAREACHITREPAGADVVTISPTEAGGLQAPLGWTLAEPTQQALRAQLPEADCFARDRPQRISPEDDPDHGAIMCANIRSVHSWFSR